MRSVVEFDRLEREKKTETRLQRGKNIEDNELLKLESSAARKEESFFHASAGDEAYTIRGEDGEDYEELEVTDDEEDENPSKRQRTEDMGSEEPIEFNEDDIAYQLASMGQDYGLDPGEYGDGRDEDLEDGAEGLTLTESDAIALFKDMLDDHRISPFTTWEKVIEAGQIVEDHRYVVLSNMKSRKDIWAMWSRDKIQLLKEQRERMEKQDPRIPYLSFLQNYATPKLYWPEFRRKYRKEPELRDVKLSDKDREKLYRDYINRKSILEWTKPILKRFIGLKLPESTLKSDLVTLLKNIPLQSLNRSTLPDALPPALITDLRYVSLRPSIRDPLIETHISTLAAPLGNVDVLPGEQAAMLKEQRERERREKALFDRQKQVEEHKRKQEGVLRFSKDMLREGEQEMERAMKVGKEGLKGYMNLEGWSSKASHCILELHNQP